MRILIVGATGYLGSWLSKSLSMSGYEVLAWGRRTPENVDSWAESFLSFNQGDINNDDTFADMVKQEPDAILYCMSMDHHESEKAISKSLKANVEPVWKLLDLLSRSKRPVRFIYLSTAHIYGPLKGMISEERSALPRNHYALTHLMAEGALLRYQLPPECSCVSLRLSNGYGAPYFEDANCWWLVINDLCQMAARTGEIHLQSDGTPQRDFVHIQDIIHAVGLILSSPIEALKFPVYNLGGGETNTILALAKIVSEVYEQKTGTSIPVFLPGGEAALDAPDTITDSFTFSIDRIAELGYKPVVELSMGISSVIDYVIERR